MRSRASASGRGEPAEFLGLVVEGDGGGGGAGDVVEQEKMLGAHELGRVDAVLDQRELDVAEGKAGFLEDFTLQRGGGGFSTLDFSAGDAPAAAPFVGADHQDAAVSIVDQRTDGGDRPRDAAAAVEQAAQDAEIGHGDVRADGGEDPAWL